MPADPEFRFGGFRLPQYTQTPNEFFDVLAPKLTEAELRVLIYVIRRTFGFHKSADAISVSQMVSGITNAQGEIIDHGTGMSKSAVWRGTKGLLEKGVLQVARLQNPDGEYETNIYSLRFAEE
ncbi:MAG TPA: replication protein, partial [Roseomonas sp.]